MRQCEQKGAAGGVRLHQAADVDVALGDDAVERRHHALIHPLLVQHPQLRLLGDDVGGRDPHRSFARLQGQAVGVALLLGRPALLHQLAVAVPGHLGEVAVGLCLLEAGA